MNKRQVIRKTEEFVKRKLKGDVGHDWQHVDRVRRNALYIGRLEKADLFVVELAALLHDIADWKFNKDPLRGGKLSHAWLTQNKVDAKSIGSVCFIVDNISWKGGVNRIGMNSIEGMVVQDADRLEAIGAIGIARMFTYGGFANRPIHDTEGSTTMHFYDKLLHMKDRMNTRTGKRLATRRHKFMKMYLKEFLREWDSV